MTISKTKNGTKADYIIEGRLETATAPDLEKAVKEDIDELTDITFDFSGLEYISSAGLRVLLSAQKSIMGKGNVTVANPNDVVREIFDVTGFSDILTII